MQTPGEKISTSERFIMNGNFDWGILYWIQDNIRCDSLDRFFLGFTKLGNKGLIWLLLSGQMLLTKKYRKVAFCVVIGMALGIIIGNMLIKNIVLRPRPCWLESGIQYLIFPHDYSYPSGHALSCTIAATIMFLSDKKLGIVAIPVAVLIAFSRLYLFVHFPTDVFGGILLGFLIAYVVLRYAGLFDTGLNKRYPCKP